MVVPRSVLSGALRRTVIRRAGANIRSRTTRHLGRRGYASSHGGQQSSELPWIIGSVVVTVPAAGWLYSQGPSSKGHGHDEHHEEPEDKPEGGEEESKEEAEPKEEGDEPKEDDKPKDEDSEPKEDGDKGKDEPEEGESEQSKGDGAKAEDSEDASDDKQDEEGDDGKDKDGYELPPKSSPAQINYKSSMGGNRGPGEGQKGPRDKSETAGQKGSASSSSGAKHPYIDDAEKSKKGQGITETAKIHGTVDSSGGARGVGKSGDSN